MAICEYVNCKGTYQPRTSWQKYCSSKCRDDDHYHQWKLARSREAEERQAARLEVVNGGEPKPLREILHLKPETLPEPEPSFKRAW
jgi:hypothetical protein